MGARDLELVKLARLDWNPAAAGESLAAVAKHAVDHAQAAIDWYRRARKGKRRAARAVRVLAILLFGAAGALPMIQELAGAGRLSGIWASLAAAVGGLLLAYDKFFGLSSGWVRYIVAEDAIRSAQQDFEFAWQVRLAALAERAGAAEEVQHALDDVKAFAGRVNSVVSEETQKWVVEFQASLGEIEQMGKAVEAASRTGSVVVTVTNGDVVDPPGWTLDSEFGRPRTVRGRSAAVAGLVPGDHVLRLSAKTKDKELHAETIAAVQAGRSTSVEVTLA